MSNQIHKYSILGFKSKLIFFGHALAVVINIQVVKKNKKVLQTRKNQLHGTSFVTPQNPDYKYLRNKENEKQRKASKNKIIFC